MICVLFAASAEAFAKYEAPLRAAFGARGVPVDLCLDAPPEQVDFIIYAPSSPLQDFTPYTRVKAVLSLWAGVERIVDNPTLTQPLCRMVDPSLTQGMVEYVCGHVLRYHLGMDAQLQATSWHAAEPPLAHERRIGILGLGALGSACARALAGLGFEMHGWSSRAKSIQGVQCHHGSAGLATCLAQSDILVTLLPLTPQTDCLLNAARLAQLPRGACLINPGRGALIDDDALLAALDSGQISHATLDVFRVEPLPQTHPFWAHPCVTITPHIAATTRARSAADVIADNVARAQAGQALLHLVDRTRGY